MRKRYPAQHMTIFAIYRKSWMFGHPARYFKMAVPSRDEALKWVDKLTGEGSPWTKDDMMIEEMPAIMKAWEP